MNTTTPRPTPETDAEVGYFDLETAVSADFARKLERERDEMREELQQWKMLCAWGGTPEHIDQFIKGQQSRIHQAQDIEETCEQLERERDEALAKLSTVYRWIERNHSDGFIDSQSHLQNLDRVADAWHDKLEDMQRELSKTRDQLQAMREAIKEAHTELSTLLDTINNSRGVDGWHLNGDIATWDEFEINPAAALTKLQPFLP